MTTATRRRRLGWRAAFASKANVTRAVILRDVRTRYFDHGLGFLIVPLWPIVHLLVLSSFNTLMGRPSPFGESPLIFFATGLLPTLIFMYVSRFMSTSLIENKPMLAFPVVRVVDIVFARAYLEIVGAILAGVLIAAVFLSIGEDPFPADPFQAIYALVGITLLSVGAGIIVSVLSLVSPFFVTVYMLFLVIVYVGSGALFVPTYMPSPVTTVLEWNPLTHAIEWLRTAFYEGYPRQILDKSYLFVCAAGSIFFGLTLERVLRQRLLVN